MTVNFDSLLFGPLHGVFGTPATVTPVAGDPVSLVVIDATEGIEIPGRNALDVATVRPVAIARATAMVAAGLARADLKGAALALNGRTYRIETTQPRPTPNGEGDGEVLLVLIER